MSLNNIQSTKIIYNAIGLKNNDIQKKKKRYISDLGLSIHCWVKNLIEVLHFPWVVYIYICILCTHTKIAGGEKRKRKWCEDLFPTKLLFIYVLKCFLRLILSIFFLNFFYNKSFKKNANFLGNQNSKIKRKNLILTKLYIFISLFSKKNIFECI